MTPADRDAVVAQAELWLGTRWHHNARVLGAGVDCGQLLIAAYVGAGLVEDFSVGQYASSFMFHRKDEHFLGWVQRHMDEVEQPSRADVAMWRFGHVFSHGAIVVDWPKIIHAHKPEGRVTYGDATKGVLLMNGTKRREVRFFTLRSKK